MKLTSDSLHNPDYKLVSMCQDTDKGYVELVYGISNAGTNEGLEAYYHETSDFNFYTSRRWEPGKIPSKYQQHFTFLQNHSALCKPGHKIEIELAY